jgi:hypothetical protein
MNIKNFIFTFDGDEYAIKDGDKTICCDCGLTHINKIKIKDYPSKGPNVFFQSWRDNEYTEFVRKKRGITVSAKKPREVIAEEEETDA